MNAMEMKVADLKPHPKNEEIYGANEDISDLVAKIKKSGRVHTMTVNSNGVVLAGHRRLKACIELGIETVKAEIVDFETPEEEIEFIINDNSTREKTTEQRSREAKELKRVETLLAEKRLSILGATGGRGNKKGVAVSPQGLGTSERGKARDIVASKLNFTSGREAERAIMAVNKIDELRKAGRVEDAELIRGVLNNRSISAAEELARTIDIVKIPQEEKLLIQSGKKSSYSYVEQAKQKQKPKEDAKTCKTCGKTYSIHMFYKGRNDCKNCCSAKDSGRRSGVVKDLFGNPLPYDKELANSQAVKDAIAHLKRDPSKDTNEIDYGMEFKLFKITLDDYYFANQKFIDGEVFNGMPIEIKNEFSKEVDNLANYVQLLKMHLKK